MIYLISDKITSVIILENSMNKSLQRNILAISTILLWSTAFPITRNIGGQITTTTLAFVRCVIASIFLIIIWRLQKNRRLPAKSDLILFVLAGLTGFSIYLLCFNKGLTTITSAESSVIVALTPIFVAVISHFAYNEKLNVLGWVSTFGAFTGVVVLMLWGNGLDIKPGMLWTLSAAVLFSTYMLINRKLSALGYSSIDVVTFGMIFSSLSLIWVLPSAIQEVPTIPMSVNMFVLYLGIFPSGISYALWGGALALANKASEVTNFMFVTPLLATLEGIIFLHESPTVATFLGGGLIISMVVLFNLTKDRMKK